MTDPEPLFRGIWYKQKLAKDLPCLNVPVIFVNFQGALVVCLVVCGVVVHCYGGLLQCSSSTRTLFEFGFLSAETKWLESLEALITPGSAKIVTGLGKL
jgi:hypothetical protein